MHDIDNPSWVPVWYFFHNIFPYDNFTKTSEITLNSSEITVRGQKSQLNMEEKQIIVFQEDGFQSLVIYLPSDCCNIITI